MQFFLVNQSTPKQVLIQSIIAKPKNSFPKGHAYLGNGLCGHVSCDTGGIRALFSGHGPRLGGKGCTCKARWDTGGGSLRFSATPTMPLSLNKEYPVQEPEVGRNNSCQNGLTEKVIKASEPPIGMGLGKL
ncbi:hypothetical protein [Prochlorococcus marinus]|uniref:hypothetical protein n=1 Tax=Prochlorococcus marinus TaxID=1219 RepID=UPI0039A5ABC4